jgi:5-methyltetrahydrofolate--homocysteine methyltransferase
MVPRKKLLLLIEHNVDIIGLSGLITPSLDEMVHLAKELDKRGLKSHNDWWSNDFACTYCRENYLNIETVIHVNDASRAVTVAGSLLNKDKKYASDIRAEYDAFREFLNRSRDKNFLTLSKLAKTN